MTQQRIMWYFADPMCSWCWGFAPVVSAIKAAYPEQLEISLVLGGLRPGTTEPITAALRGEILHHWHEVQRRTGQPFTFEGAMPDGFVYDTEPPSRAVIAVAEIDPEETFPYLKSVQAAFYAHGQNVTQAQTLAALAASHRIAATRFLEHFHAEAVKRKTRTHFQQAREAGIRGFPSVVLQNKAGTTLLTSGYRPFEELRPLIDAWLASA